eukprot:CAMPEP_0113963486 /NCGR_PEP_ID=MMETSP0011_2-20120614/6542_1 /TAXON_ID=101924 /ORGANISM="Rhodosorus marinus" /LENGTH=58 /DNA_ID=CAMNT_0000975545 /DNA_START=168 /DNA_END=344 /DNA_ORIENTATION=+ /assembly_acc=CAM_ASM_000156
MGSRSGFYALGVAILGTAATIAYVHYSQKAEAARMKDGVRRDILRLAAKEKERAADPN